MEAISAAAPTGDGGAPSGPFGRPLPWVYVDGEWVTQEEARFSVHANVVSYGTGTFEGIRATWNPEHEQLYMLDAAAHYERMAQSARVPRLTLPLSPAQLVDTSAELLRRNEARGDVYLRPLYVLSGEQLSVRMHQVQARLSIAATPIVGDYIDPAGVRCTISSWRRPPDVVMPSRAKLCGSYVGPAMAKSEALAAGFDEALMLNTGGYVAEGTTSNVFLRRGDQWATPAVNEDILEGITRAHLLTLLAEQSGHPVDQRRIHPTELFVCDELLLCGTAALVVPVVEVDGRPVGNGEPGQTTLTLLDDLRAIARRDDERHHEWTAPVYATDGDR